MRFIGDVHGKFEKYKKIAESAPASIQVGDFGAGFKPIPDMGPEHRFIRGNHDSPEVCKSHSNWIPDGHSAGGIFFVGGATSIDAHSRVEGVEYWRDEELTIQACNDVIDTYELQVQQNGAFEVIVSHECPENIARIIFKNRLDKMNEGSRTRQMLEAIHGISQPRFWIFGHWHHSIDTVINGTRFICLNELDHIDLDVG